MRLDWSEANEKYLIDNYGKIPTRDIAKHLGSPSTERIVAKAARMGLASPERTRTQLVEIPKKFNIESMDRDENGKVCAECPYCKKRFWTKPSALSLGYRKSCGCVNIGRRKGAEHVSLTYFNLVYRGAIKRNLDFNITINYVSDLLKNQDFKCKLSGLDLIYGYKPKKELTASLDRIDSDIGYVEGNVQWVHKFINIMKWDLPDDTFIYLCRCVSYNNQDKLIDIKEIPQRYYKYMWAYKQN